MPNTVERAFQPKEEIIKMRQFFDNGLTKSAAGYTIGASSVAAALALSLFFQRWVEPSVTPLFLAAVTLTAWRAGKYPSLFAAVLAVTAIDFFFQPPLYALELSPVNTVNAIIFLFGALFINWIDEARKKAFAERDRLLKSERAARLAAEEANRAKDKFLAMVTHDLRAPLNAILGWTQMLKKEHLDESKVKKAIDVIERNSRAQAKLIEDLLDISRIRAGKFEIDPKPIDLCRVVDEAIESVAASVTGKRIRLCCELDRQAGSVYGDADRLRQIVWNLLSNAVKFTHEGGVIEIRLERVNSHTRLVVYDSGIGIRPDFLPFVFDSFRQSENNPRAKSEGLGLGLAIVRHLVEAHGGTVRATSAGLGLGATFTVELPLLLDASFAPNTRGWKQSQLYFNEKV
jgi:signal transduction histidine kinase